MIDFDKIIEILDKKRKSQAWLYKRAGITNGGWNGMKDRGDMKVSDLVKIAEILKVDVTDIVIHPETYPTIKPTASVQEAAKLYGKEDFNNQLLDKMDRFLTLFEQSVNKTR